MCLASHDERQERNGHNEDGGDVVVEDVCIHVCSLPPVHNSNGFGSGHVNLSYAIYASGDWLVGGVWNTVGFAWIGCPAAEADRRAAGFAGNGHVVAEPSKGLSESRVAERAEVCWNRERCGGICWEWPQCGESWQTYWLICCKTPQCGRTEQAPPHCSQSQQAPPHCSQSQRMSAVGFCRLFVLESLGGEAVIQSSERSGPDDRGVFPRCWERP